MRAHGRRIAILRELRAVLEVPEEELGDSTRSPRLDNKMASPNSGRAGVCPSVSPPAGLIDDTAALTSECASTLCFPTVDVCEVADAVLNDVPIVGVDSLHPSRCGGGVEDLEFGGVLHKGVVLVARGVEGLFE